MTPHPFSRGRSCTFSRRWWTCRSSTPAGPVPAYTPMAAGSAAACRGAELAPSHPCTFCCRLLLRKSSLCVSCVLHSEQPCHFGSCARSPPSPAKHLDSTMTWDGKIEMYAEYMILRGSRNASTRMGFLNLANVLLKSCSNTSSSCRTETTV